jgi:hypothetical protein
MKYEEIFEEHVDSSWISDLTYSDKDGGTIMTTLQGRQYFFKMSKRDYDMWMKYWSKGTFYHNYLRQ